MTESGVPAGPGVTLANWRTAQFLQWSFQHSREIVPTARVSRGNGAWRSFRPRPVSLLDVAVPAAEPTTVEDVLATTYTDGFLLLHDGTVVSEEYPAGMAPDALHALLSVTKSMVGCVAAVLVDRGLLDPAAPLTTYVPELATGGYAGATVRHLLDMRSGIIFSEDYLDPEAEIRRLEQCIGWSPAGDLTAPASLYDFLVTLRQGGPHGGPFAIAPARRTYWAGSASEPAGPGCRICCPTWSGAGSGSSTTPTSPSTRRAWPSTTAA